MKGPILEAQGLSKVYRRGASEVRAVDGIDLDVEAGEFMAIMGRSGSGKTTLLDLLGCLLRPTGGQLAIDGRSVIGASDGELATIRRERIGFVFQEFNLIPTLTAIENVLLPLRYGPRRPDAKARATELLELVGLAERATHRPTELSGGEQQRVAIATAVANDPRVLFADEPTGADESHDDRGTHRTFPPINRVRDELGQRNWPQPVEKRSQPAAARLEQPVVLDHPVPARELGVGPERPGQRAIDPMPARRIRHAPLRQPQVSHLIVRCTPERWTRTVCSRPCWSQRVTLLLAGSLRATRSSRKPRCCGRSPSAPPRVPGSGSSGFVSRMETKSRPTQPKI